MNVKFILDAVGLANVNAYRFENGGLQPLSPDSVDFPTQSQKSVAQRLDTGSTNAPIYNWLGLQVFSSATLIDEDSNTSFELLTVILEVRQSKNIDKVSVSGLNGTIKTYINDSDFEINMKVVLTSDNANDYPLDQVKQLVALLRLPRALKIVSDFLVMFDIYSIVIEDYSLPQLEGTQNTATLSIAALSDTPIELLAI